MHPVDNDDKNIDSMRCINGEKNSKSNQEYQQKKNLCIYEKYKWW